MKTSNILLCVLLNTTILFSQNNKSGIERSVVLKNIFDNLEQEKFFLHTNKTTYFTGEKIWWKAYIVSDFNNKPSTNTTNLYINFYDSNKSLITHQLFYCDNGKAFGEITLPEHLKTDRYYLSLDTQWNKNFDYKYVVLIDIINTKTDKKEELLDNHISNQSDGKELEMEFHPESGALLERIDNMVFFTVKKGDAYLANVKGNVVIDATGEEITKLESNIYGYGMFKLPYKTDHSYTAKINFNNRVYAFKIKQERHLGIIIQKIESKSNDIQKFSIKISKEIAKSYHKREMFATIYKNNKLLFVVPFQINEQYLSYSLKILDENLSSGVNTIALFNDTNELIAERPFFIKPNLIDIEVIQNEATKDSLTLDFRLKDTISSNLSISVLPQHTKLNNNPTTILSEFLVNPYITSTLQSNLFFNNNLSDLEKDIFLQVHAKKRAKNGSNSSKLDPFFKKEYGLTIKGTINTSIKDLQNHKVLLSSTENKILLLAPVGPNKSFEFNQLSLKEKTNYKLALLDKKGKIVKASFYIYDLDKYKVDSLLVYSQPVFKTIENQEPIKLNTDDYILPKDQSIERLDEVTVYGKKRKDELIEEAYPNDPKELGNGFIQSITINDADRMNYSILEFLDNHPGISASEYGITASVIFMRAKYSTFNGNKEALILFNGAPIETNVLVGMRLNDVKSIKINISGAGYGLRGMAGVVSIESKNGTEQYKTIPNENLFLSEVDFGFTPSNIKFEAYPLIFSSKLSRSYYETLDWIPSFDLQPNTFNNLQVYKGTHQSLKLFINGMNDEGQLIYKVIDISIKDKF